MKTQSIILVLTVSLLLCSGCGSKEKEIEAAKAQLELAKQKEFEATKAQLEVAKEQEVQAIKAQLEIAKQKELEAVKAQLELARAKSSLDEMFLALKALQALGDKSETTASEVDNARTGVELLQKTRIAKGEHRHEDVVQHAAEVLELFPTHPEARKEMKESGLIFRYLQLALEHENACFVGDQTGGVQLVKLTKEKSEKEGTDFTTIAFNLKKANDFVDEAIKLDAQYDAALGLKHSVRQMQNTMGYLIAQSIFKTSNLVRPRLDELFSVLRSGIQDDALKGRLGSPQGFWRQTRDLRDQAEELVKSLMASMQEQASFLNQLETPDI